MTLKEIAVSSTVVTISAVISATGATVMLTELLATSGPPVPKLPLSLVERESTAGPL